MRRHWGIENHQHWHLDVTFAEDACQCQRDHAPHNLSTLRKLALTLLQRCRQMQEVTDQTVEVSFGD